MKATAISRDFFRNGLNKFIVSIYKFDTKITVLNCELYDIYHF